MSSSNVKKHKNLIVRSKGVSKYWDIDGLTSHGSSSLLSSYQDSGGTKTIGQTRLYLNLLLFLGALVDCCVTFRGSIPNHFSKIYVLYLFCCILYSINYGEKMMYLTLEVAESRWFQNEWDISTGAVLSSYKRST